MSPGRFLSRFSRASRRAYVRKAATSHWQRPRSTARVVLFRKHRRQAPVREESPRRTRSRRSRRVICVTRDEDASLSPAIITRADVTALTCRVNGLTNITLSCEILTAERAVPKEKIGEEKCYVLHRNERAGIM